MEKIKRKKRRKQNVRNNPKKAMKRKSGAGKSVETKDSKKDLGKN